ncbi:hypothetical protein HPB48_014510 [Haemaphysalis longicornis]|uniref:Endonuclease/exonuclease/phosphatase domain-containing protein n=1 Tax=Haemaphysalis longicornis TaxID=44386 RepID=A0A9J6FRZ7_HAELO|nr:hypothetical protein HPB48_014510 [Haemaphysalis longicornis]
MLHPHRSLNEENRHSFDLRLAMLERQLREQQRVFPGIATADSVSHRNYSKQPPPVLPPNLRSSISTLPRFTTAPSATQIMPLADLVESTSTAQHTRLVQLETSILKVLTALNAQSEQLKSFGSIAISLQEHSPRLRKRTVLLHPLLPRCPVLRVWRWCSGTAANLRNNKTPLHQYLLNRHFLPHFLLIQEARATSAIPNYRAYHAATSTPLAFIYVPGDRLVEPLDIPCTLLKYLVGVVYYDPSSKISRALLSFYNPPVTSSLFSALGKFLHSLPSTTNLILGGDFNAPHTLWGYPQTLKPGRLLHCLVQERHLTLLNTPGSPTRAGTTSQQPTTPDLTFSRGPLSVQWRVTAGKPPQATIF